MTDDPSDLSWIARLYSEASSKLADYSARVADGRDAQAALEFSAWVLWSGLVPLCLHHSRDSTPKIDGALLRWKSEELQRDARERLGRPGALPFISMTQLQALNHKMDLIAGAIAKLQGEGKSDREKQT